MIKTALKLLFGLDLLEKEPARYIRKLVHSTCDLFVPGMPYPKVRFAVVFKVARANINKLVLPAEEMRLAWKYRFEPVFDFLEYEQFSHDPRIGDLKRVTGEEYIRCAMAHELAHVFHIRAISKQYPDVAKAWMENLGLHPKDRILRDKKRHGLFWQAIYAEVRSVLLTSFWKKVIKDMELRRKLSKRIENIRREGY